MLSFIGTKNVKYDELNREENIEDAPNSEENIESVINMK